jgi:hypothetical protein
MQDNYKRLIAELLKNVDDEDFLRYLYILIRKMAK